jgi:tetratricopeptide (TPR) repeat protein
MFVITWLVGLAITVSEVAIYRDRWGGQVAWWRAIVLFVVTSFSYFFFYNLAHRLQFNRQITVTSLDDVIRAADVLAYGLVIFYIFLLLLMLLLALTLAWRQMARLPLWRAELINVLLYPVLILAMVTVVWFKNVNVVRADIYLKEGDRYRNSGQWEQAVALHKKASAIDADEDFYYLMLALDYQLMAQDQNLAPAQQQLAWQEGERIALEARRVNPYNPDNTGNMGRYYFTLGQAANRERLGDALQYFQKAILLAPSNVVYHNLLAQTHYILQDYQAALERLQTSVSIDDQYAPTWLLLGDTYAAMGNAAGALEAHRQSIALANDFFDQFLDQRLNFYISAGRLPDLITALQQVAQTRPTDPTLPWAIGHAYNLSGQLDQALPHFEQARQLGDGSDRLTRELANAYLALEMFDQALPNYQRLLEYNPNDPEAHSALAFIYARQGRLAEAIQENQIVLQLLPSDYDSLKNLAILYQQQGQWQEALAVARQAQAVAPEAKQPSWQQFIADLEQQIAATG